LLHECLSLLSPGRAVASPVYLLMDVGLGGLRRA
jgi:hypothetical protein